MKTQQEFKLSEQIEAGHHLEINEVSEALKADLNTGLTREEVKYRQDTFGLNEVKVEKRTNWKLYLSPFFDRMILIFLVMVIILLFFSFWYPSNFSQAVFWFYIVVFNISFAVAQQIKARKKLESLHEFSPDLTSVRRNSRNKKIAPSELVPGDLIRLSTGDRVPADCRIISSNSLLIDQSILTGEADPVLKVKDGSKKYPKEIAVHRQENIVHHGTYVVNGNANLIVLRTGVYTEIGKIASSLFEYQNSLDSSLRHRVNQIANWLALGVLLSMFFSIVGSLILIEITPELNFSMEIIALYVSESIIIAMSIMPINIPLLTVIILITGLTHLAKNNVLVQKLSVIESLGRTTVLCTDKTGTITTSKMTVVKIWDTEGYFSVFYTKENKIILVEEKDGESSIVDLDGDLKEEGSGIEYDYFAQTDTSLELALIAATLNNDANLKFEDYNQSKGHLSFDPVGNPTDVALFKFGHMTRFKKKEAKKRYSLRKEYPFDSTLKTMSKMFYDTLEQDYMVFTKGASERVLDSCTTIGNESYGPPRVLSESEKKEIYEEIKEHSSLGYRVVSVAYKAFKEEPSNLDGEKERGWMESNLTFIGYFCLIDPPREGTKEAVAMLDKAGIFPVMITGDSKETAKSIASEVGIFDKDEIVVEGKDIEKLLDEDFFKVSVFARVNPIDKKKIITRYQDKGHVVAMAGDGVNDSPAIAKADSGMAMGITGSRITKDAADIVISDDSYASIVTGIQEGRSIFENIRMLVFFFIAVNLAEGSIYIFTSFIPGFFILSVWQKTYIFSIVHAIPPIVIILNTAAENTMEIKPRKSDKIIGGELLNVLVIVSITLIIMLVTAYFLGLINLIPVNDFNTYISNPEVGVGGHSPINLAMAKARTYFITITFITEPLLVISLRRMNYSIFDSIKDLTPYLAGMLFISPLIHILVMYVPFIQIFFESGLDWVIPGGIHFEILALDILDWILILIAGLIPILCLEVYKYYKRQNGKLI